jgi:hypothetical protein
VNENLKWLNGSKGLKILVIVIGLVMFISIAYATPKGPADYNGFEKKHHLYLYSKDPSDWGNDEKWGPEWGKLSWKEDKFVFNGHKLAPNTEYALIRFEYKWPECQILGYGTSDESGSVHIKGSWTLWHNKFWLIRAEDLKYLADPDEDCWHPIDNWAPEHWLFEYNELPPLPS